MEGAVSIPADEPVENVASVIVNWLKQLKDEQGNRTYLHHTRDPDTHEQLFNLQRELQVLRKQEGKAPDLGFVRGALKRIPPIQRLVLRDLTGVMSAACQPQNLASNSMSPHNFAMCTFPEVMAAVQVMIEQHHNVFHELFPEGEACDSAEWLRQSRDTVEQLSARSTGNTRVRRRRSRRDSLQEDMSVAEALNREMNSRGFLQKMSEAEQERRTT